MSPPTNTPLPTAQSTTSQNSPHETPVHPSLSTSFQGLSSETPVPTAPSTAYQDSPHEVPKRLAREKYCQDQDEMISNLHTLSPVFSLLKPRDGTAVQGPEEKAKALLDTGELEVDQWRDLALKGNLAKLPQPADINAAEDK
ncbi:hypothetical protein BGZ74_005686 [Mortierella antarctica]|nr:hypothetical protein BGZ74_005686 [Mortierella antarctica]